MSNIRNSCSLIILLVIVFAMFSCNGQHKDVNAFKVVNEAVSHSEKVNPFDSTINNRNFTDDFISSVPAMIKRLSSVSKISFSCKDSNEIIQLDNFINRNYTPNNFPDSLFDLIVAFSGEYIRNRVDDGKWMFQKKYITNGDSIKYPVIISDNTMRVYEPYKVTRETINNFRHGIGRIDLYNIVTTSMKSTK